MFGHSVVPTVTCADIADAESTAPGSDAREALVDPYLIDVREPDEWLAGHQPDARHVPLMQLPARLAEVPTDRPVVLVCRVGQRSAQAVVYLRRRGWDNVYNLDGGLVEWAAAGRPLVSEDGRAARVI
jgi:rhodanese-related sulfurtransferase